jgi:deoxyribonuclease V
VLWDAEVGEAVGRAWAEAELSFPYVPGLLTFREGPVLLKAWDRLAAAPDLLMFDGNGYAHPRRCGLASHMGVVLGRPSVGVAKSRLCGQQRRQPGLRRGAAADLVDQGEVIARVLRTRDGVKPVFVSVGHGVTLDDAVRLTLACGAGYRLPEPTRLADQLVGRVKRGEV